MHCSDYCTTLHTQEGFYSVLLCTAKEGYHALQYAVLRPLYCSALSTILTGDILKCSVIKCNAVNAELKMHWAHPHVIQCTIQLHLQVLNVYRSELFATKGFTTLMHLKNIHIACRTIHSAQVGHIVDVVSCSSQESLAMCIAFQCNAPSYIAVHWISIHFNAMQWVSVQCIELHCIGLHCCNRV